MDHKIINYLNSENCRYSWSKLTPQQLTSSIWVAVYAVCIHELPHLQFYRWLSWATSIKKMKCHKPSQLGKRVSRAMDDLNTRFTARFRKRKHEYNNSQMNSKKQKPNLQLSQQLQVIWWLHSGRKHFSLKMVNSASSSRMDFSIVHQKGFTSLRIIARHFLLVGNDTLRLGGKTKWVAWLRDAWAWNIMSLHCGISWNLPTVN